MGVGGGAEGGSLFFASKFTRAHFQFWSRSKQKTSVRFNECPQFLWAVVGHSGWGDRWAEQKIHQNMDKAKQIQISTWIRLIQVFHSQILKSGMKAVDILMITSFSASSLLSYSAPVCSCCLLHLEHSWCTSILSTHVTAFLPQV